METIVQVAPTHTKNWSFDNYHLPRELLLGSTMKEDITRNDVNQAACDLSFQQKRILNKQSKQGRSISYNYINLNINDNLLNCLS